MTNQDLFAALWDKYLSDKKMSVADIRQLRAFVHDAQYRQQLDESLFTLFMEQTEVYAAHDINETEMFREAWDKLHQAEPVDADNVNAAGVVELRSRTRWWQWPAAAVILLTAGAGVYWFTGNKKAGEQVAQHQGAAAPASITPGSNKAILTLTDGSVIALNDAANGELAQQGGTRVVKLANGQLAYQHHGGNAAANLFNTVATPRGGKYNITLPDGTKVWLNAASSLHYPTAFTGAQREVTLTGEGYFEIAEQASKPFVVKLSNMQVQVLGTHFNVMAYTDEEAVQTTLLQGKVKVVSGTAAEKVLLPGECASLLGNGSLKVKRDVNTEETIAWKNNMIQFAGTDVRAAMRMIARWYDVDVEYSGAVPNAHFRGAISSDAAIGEVLNMMQQTGEVHFRISGRKIIVMP